MLLYTKHAEDYRRLWQETFNWSDDLYTSQAVEGYIPKKDTNYMGLCGTVCVKDDFYDEERRCLQTGSSQSRAALNDLLETTLRIANVIGESSCIGMLRIVTLY